MTKGISIHVGLNNVDVAAYPDLIVPELAGCHNDARDMQKIADDEGFSSSVVLDEEATAGAVSTLIEDAASQLTAGDILLVTYSGHGSQIPDVDDEESDSQDETWVMYDRMLLDDELYALWSKFESDIRIFLVSDSCHSGTVARMLTTRIEAYKDLAEAPVSREVVRVPRSVGGRPELRGIPADQMIRSFRKRRALYERVKASTPKTKDLEIGASVILISGCMDNQESADGTANGLFTETLKAIWDDGSFSGDYSSFHAAILADMPATQSPNYYLTGRADPTFEGQRPFSINGASSGNGTGGTVSDGGTLPGGTTSGAPSVSGPASWSRSESPPTFQVDTGSNQYYVFEIASDPTLFDAANFGEQRNSNNFYATWDDTSAEARMTSSEYQLSPDAWSALSLAEWLYYRVGTTSSESADEWADYAVSTDDGDGSAAPSIEITD